MIIKKKIYIANINLEIDISNLSLIKFRSEFSARGYMLWNKVSRTFVFFYIGYNYKKL